MTPQEAYVDFLDEQGREPATEELQAHLERQSQEHDESCVCPSCMRYLADVLADAAYDERKFR